MKSNPRPIMLYYFWCCFFIFISNASKISIQHLVCESDLVGVLLLYSGPKMSLVVSNVSRKIHKAKHIFEHDNVEIKQVTFNENRDLYKAQEVFQFPSIFWYSCQDNNEIKRIFIKNDEDLIQFLNNKLGTHRTVLSDRVPVEEVSNLVQFQSRVLEDDRMTLVLLCGNTNYVICNVALSIFEDLAERIEHTAHWNMIFSQARTIIDHFDLHETIAHVVYYPLGRDKHPTLVAILQDGSDSLTFRKNLLQVLVNGTNIIAKNTKEDDEMICESV